MRLAARLAAMLAVVALAGCVSQPMRAPETVELSGPAYAAAMEALRAREALVEGARSRLRPIIMTSLAFTLGVVPLALASGAGAGSSHAIGTGVIGGMITAPLLSLFIIPAAYKLMWLHRHRVRK